MQNDSPSDPLLERIRSAIRLYQCSPSQGITSAELINKLFLDLGQFDRYELVNDVVALIPESVRGELRQLVEAILRAEAAYVPFTIGRPADPAAWRQQMIPTCRKLATLFQQHLDTMAPDSGQSGGW